MCTLTVITGNDDYLMAMNRDEKIARGAGLPPEIHEFDGTTAMYPSDGEGGTWFAANEYGITLALLNWNDVAPKSIDATRHGAEGVIPTLIDSRSLSDLHAVFGASNFAGMMPFRLVGVFPSEQEIWEWRWDSAQLECQVHEWESRHWFSSSLSDERAEEPAWGSMPQGRRQRIGRRFLRWLRRLHASHAGGPGPFSLCVHREDVKTLSYTEVMVQSGSIRMCHFRGSPCTMNPADSTEIEIERKRPVRPNLIVREVGCPFEFSHLNHAYRIGTRLCSAKPAVH